MRAHITALLLSFYAVSVCAQQAVWAQKALEEDREALVYQSIADMAINRDKLLQRYAVLLEGEMSEFDRAEPYVLPMIVVRCSSAKHQYDYAAKAIYRSAVEFDASADLVQRQREEWEERIRSRGRVKVFKGEKRFGADYTNVGTGQDATDAIKKLGIRVPEFDPFDDFVGYGSGILSPRRNRGSMERIFLQNGEFLSVEKGLGGQIVSKWDNGWPTDPLVVSITHSAAKNYMPVDVTHKPETGTTLKDFSHTRLSWKKFDGVLLPFKIEFAYPVFGRRVRTSQYAFKLRWLIGDKVPDKCFDFDSDPRDPLLNLFGIDCEKDGKPADNPWTVPEDLYDTDESRQQRK